MLPIICQDNVIRYFSDFARHTLHDGGGDGGGEGSDGGGGSGGGVVVVV